MPFFTVPVNTKFKLWRKYYHCFSFPKGDSNAMRMFKKILKPVFGYLRQEGCFSVIFVDDSCIYQLTVNCNIRKMLMLLWVAIQTGFCNKLG